MSLMQKIFQKFIKVPWGGKITVVFMKFNTLLDEQSLIFPLNIVKFLFRITFYLKQIISSNLISNVLNLSN